MTCLTRFQFFFGLGCAPYEGAHGFPWANVAKVTVMVAVLGGLAGVITIVNPRPFAIGKILGLSQSESPAAVHILHQALGVPREKNLGHRLTEASALVGSTLPGPQDRRVSVCVCCLAS